MSSEKPVEDWMAWAHWQGWVPALGNGASEEPSGTTLHTLLYKIGKELHAGCVKGSGAKDRGGFMCY